MPTTIPMTHQRARAAIYVSTSGASPIAAPGRRAWDGLRDLFTSDDFRTVVTFSGLGLLVGLLVMLAGVQGVWM